MPFEQHQEKDYAQAAAAVFQAALRAAEKLEGKLVTSAPDRLFLEAKFPKVILKKTLGERTQLTCQVQPADAGCRVVVDAYPLDALERKLMFGARPGVTATVISWFLAHLEHNLGLPVKSA